MSEHKTTTELIAEIDYEISHLENNKESLSKAIYVIDLKLNNLTERRKSIMSYENHDSINQDKTE